MKIAARGMGPGVAGRLWAMEIATWGYLAVNLPFPFIPC